MTRYTVVWLNDAVQDVAALWLDSFDRNAIADASQRIKDDLSEGASTKGEALSEGLRVIERGPLRAIFEVNDEDRMVQIARVHLV